MRIMIATPAHQGLLTSRWFESFMASMPVILENGHDMSVMIADRDNIISRARNNCAMTVLENNFDKLMFIDADQVWRPEHLLLLLKSDKKIVGGTYPYRKFPISPIFNVLPENKDEFNMHKNSREDFINFVKTHADLNGEVEVLHLPTGFMLIDVSVFKELSKVRPKYMGWDDTTKKQKEVYDFFPIQLADQPGTDLKAYETEDWGFCSVARKAGFKIYLQTKCLVDHVGNHQFSMKDNK